MSNIVEGNDRFIEKLRPLELAMTYEANTSAGQPRFTIKGMYGTDDPLAVLEGCKAISPEHTFHLIKSGKNTWSVYTFDGADNFAEILGSNNFNFKGKANLPSKQLKF